MLALRSMQRTCDQTLLDLTADEAESAFDKQGWLADKPAFMQRRYEELFKQQDAVDEHLANLQKERYELEKKYLALTGEPARPCAASVKLCLRKSGSDVWRGVHADISRRYAAADGVSLRRRGRCLSAHVNGNMPWQL